MKRFISFSLLVALFFGGCKNDPTISDPPSSVPTTKGVYVLNEGDFNDPIGARLMFYDPATDSVFKNVYEAANNNQSLGNLGDDMVINGNNLYITMSGSDEVKVVDITSNKVLLSKQLLNDDPHDLCFDKNNNRIYVTRLYKNSILVLNGTSLELIDSVAVGSNPLGMVLVDSLLFVCNSGYGASNTVSIVNTNTLRISKNVVVGYGPSSAVVRNGKVYVACTGNVYAVPAIPSTIYSIATDSKSTVDTIAVDNYLFGASALGIDGNMYAIGSTTGSYYGGPIHKINLESNSVTKNFIEGTFYGFAIDETNGDFYLGDVKNFASDGEVVIHDKAGNFLKKFTAQRGPAVFAFKR